MSENLGVYKAIAAVTAAMAKEGIGKGRKNQQQGYSFRGIDDVYNVLSGMLATAGLCIIPRILSRVCEERTTKSGSALFYVTVEAEYDLVSAEDGSKHTAKVFGEAMDSADKATNKAMSAAYKYMAFQTFAIPTEGDNDADAVTHVVVPAAKAQTPYDYDAALDAMRGAVNSAQLQSAYTPAYSRARKDGDQVIMNILETCKDECKLALGLPVKGNSSAPHDASATASISGDPSEGDLNIPALGGKAVI
jgi:hypothetical protein